MSEVYVRGYDKTEGAGHRYAGNCMLDSNDLPAALTEFWKQAEAAGKFLIISNKPLGVKQRTFLMRKEA